MGESDITKKPKPGAGDVAHTSAKALLSLIPPVAEFFQLIVVPPLTKRRDEWILSIAEELKKLENKVDGLKIENLAENNTFISSFMYAYQVAIRNHQEEKLEALKNAVLNSASPSTLEEDLQHMFLNFIDEFTPRHLRILKFLDNPGKWVELNKIGLPDWFKASPMQVFYKAFPDMENQRLLVEQMLDTLELKGLHEDKGLHDQMQKYAYLRVTHTTDLGTQFLQFITNPPE